MSKAQSRQIVYLIMVVFALVILLFGYEAVQKITAFNREREIKNFGIAGISPRFYIGLNGNANTIIDGVPDYKKFRKTIRQYDILLGN